MLILQENNEKWDQRQGVFEAREPNAPGRSMSVSQARAPIW